MEQPKTYTVQQFKKGDFQDQNGNFWCDLALQGVGEPVRIVVKDPMQYHDGMDLYGHITNETSKQGKPYLRFRKDRKDDYHAPSGGSKPAYKTDDATQESIARSVALKAAVDFAAVHTTSLVTTMSNADVFLAWLQGGEKGSEETIKSPENAVDTAPNPKRPWENRGVSNANAVNDQQPDNYYDSMPFEGENINLDDLPLA